MRQGGWDIEEPVASTAGTPCEALVFSLDQLFTSAACTWLNPEHPDTSPESSPTSISATNDTPPLIEVQPIISAREKRKQQNRAA